MAPNIKANYDIVVVGAGIAGTTVALALQQAGIKTLVIESGKHPRFVIGESTVPGTTWGFRLIANKYKIPELRNLTRYTSEKKSIPPLADYPKAHFWFGLHEKGKELDVSHELVLETPDPPLGPDTHLVREKVDAYLVSLLPKYHVDYVDYTVIDNFEYDEENKMCHLVIRSLESKETKNISCRFIIDASGNSAFFSKKLGFFEEDAVSLKTNTRCIYGHFKTSSMPDLDELQGGACPLFRFKRSSGTLHHCFPGGWIWVIPFDDGTVSVGMILKRDVYPFKEGADPREEFFSIMNDYPTIKAHLGNLEPTRPFVHMPHIQKFSKHIVGSGVIFTPHASGFIDALFSTGIAKTVQFVLNMVPLAQTAFKTNNFDLKQFYPLEEIYLQEIFHVDNLVSGVIESYRNIETFRQFWKAWIVGVLYHFFFLIIIRGKVDPKFCGILGANVKPFREDLAKMNAILMNGKDRDQVAVALDLKQIIDRYPHSGIDHPYEFCLGQIGSRFPYVALVKSTGLNSIKLLIKNNIPPENMPRFVYLKLIKFYLMLIMESMFLKISKFLHFPGIDPYREKRLQSQRLPWFNSKYLK